VSSRVSLPPHARTLLHTPLSKWAILEFSSVTRQSDLLGRVTRCLMYDPCLRTSETPTAINEWMMMTLDGILSTDSLYGPWVSSVIEIMLQIMQRGTSGSSVQVHACTCDALGRVVLPNKCEGQEHTCWITGWSVSLCRVLFFRLNDMKPPEMS
jgi:hypothetical protein